MAKRNQQGRENVHTSVLAAVKALDLYAQFHAGCIKPEKGDTKVLAKLKKKQQHCLPSLAAITTPVLFLVSFRHQRSAKSETRKRVEG